MRIIVIDDEKIVADTLTLILKKAGYDTKAAYDGAAAVEAANTFAPECIICDVILPGMNGIAVCSQITASFPGCHVFISSGQGETNSSVVEARAQGRMWEVLAKPIGPDELLGKLAHVAAQARTD
jgi:CheY-like chemotaxis protein